MYYRETISALRMAILNHSPHPIQAQFTELEKGQTPPLSYLLWMCEEIKSMDQGSLDEALMAGRWIGWVLAHVELAGIWSNGESRNHIREDRNLGLDKPH